MVLGSATAWFLLIDYVMIFLWLSYLPLLFLNFKRMISNKRFFVTENLVRIKNDPHITFQITSRSAARSKVVERGIRAIKDSCKEIKYDEYSIVVVTDDPDDGGSGPEYDVIPADYATANGARRKARALQYAVERRRKLGVNDKGHWVFHLDEESLVIPQTVLSLLQFIREKKGLVAEGPIFYPTKMDKANRVTALAESIRPFQCYDCATQMKNPPPTHIHGSNLLVRADVEDAIGWDFPRTLAEDQMFGVRLYERFGNIFGWHGGVLLEQPPLSIKDHYRQRKRWVVGTLQNIGDFPLRLRWKIYGRIMTYLLGFLSAVGTLALYIYYVMPIAIQWIAELLGQHITVPSTGELPIATVGSILEAFRNGLNFTLTWNVFISGTLGTILLVTSVAWLLSYQVGLYWNLRYNGGTRTEKFLMHLQQLVLSPLIGIVETAPGMLAMLHYSLSKDKDIEFQIIAK